MTTTGKPDNGKLEERKLAMEKAEANAKKRAGLQKDLDNTNAEIAKAKAYAREIVKQLNALG